MSNHWIMIRISYGIFRFQSIFFAHLAPMNAFFSVSHCLLGSFNYISYAFSIHCRFSVNRQWTFFSSLSLNKIVNRLMKIQRNAYIFNFIHTKFHSWILDSITKNPNRTRYRVEWNSHVKWDLVRFLVWLKFSNYRTLWCQSNEFDV